MGYRVIRFFTDLQDNNHAYHTGDIFPREGVTVSEERIEELSSANNKQRTPLIVLVMPSVDESEKSEESAEGTSVEEKPKKPRTRKRKKADT